MAEAAAAHFANLLFLQRMRTAADRDFVARAFAQHWGTPLPSSRRPSILASPKEITIGWATLQRSRTGNTQRYLTKQLLILCSRLCLESVSSHDRFMSKQVLQELAGETSSSFCKVRQLHLSPWRSACSFRGWASWSGLLDQVLSPLWHSYCMCL